ncbi:hypothetical protein PG994_012181 [Apiospora phragmitis]|uniref:Uncharacterized protein n=1 Tax=Apiospora phragmitis TaxID=2905665 RepID=A0ABR1TX70_9PEZI
MTAPLSPPATDAAGTVIVFVPLTTAFTASPSCSTLFRQNGPSLVAYDPGYGLEIDTRTGGGRCAPAPSRPAHGRQPGAPDLSRRLVDAGLVPEGREEHRGHVLSIKSLTRPLPSALRHRGYKLANGLPGSIKGHCRSTAVSGDVLTYAMTAYSDSSAWQTATTTLTTGSFIGAIAVVGWNIRAKTGTAAAPTTASASRGAIAPQLPATAIPRRGELIVIIIAIISAGLQRQRDDHRREPRRRGAGAGRGAAGGAAAAAPVLQPERSTWGELAAGPAPPAVAEVAEQQSQSPPWWWAELPAPLGRSRTDAGMKRRPSELPDAPYQRPVAELDGGWQR